MSAGPVARGAPRPLAVASWIGVLSLVWGSTWVVIKDGLDHLPPFSSAAARFLIAALAMTVIAPSLARREGGGRPRRSVVALVGALNFFASYAIVYWSESRLPSGIVAVLWAVFPMLMATSGHLFLAGEGLGPRQWSGFALAFLGIAYLFRTDLETLGPDAAPTALVLFVSPLVSCVGTTWLKRAGAGASSALVNRDAMWIGAGGLTALALATEPFDASAWTPLAWRSVVYLALVGTVFSFTAYFWLLCRVEAYRLSTIPYLTPAIALTLGALLRGEPIGATTLLGSGAILAGVVLAVTRGQRPHGTRGAAEHADS